MVARQCQAPLPTRVVYENTDRMICDDYAGSLCCPCINNPVHTLQPLGPPFSIHPCERNLSLPDLLTLPPLLPDRLQGRDNALSVLLRHRSYYNQGRRDMLGVHHGLERVRVELQCGGEAVPAKGGLATHDLRRETRNRTSTTRA